MADDRVQRWFWQCFNFTFTIHPNPALISPSCSRQVVTVTLTRTVVASQYHPLTKLVSTGNNACTVPILTLFITVAQTTPIRSTSRPRSISSRAMLQKTIFAVSCVVPATWTWSTLFTAIWWNGTMLRPFKMALILTTTALLKTFPMLQKISVAVSIQNACHLPKNRLNDWDRVKSGCPLCLLCLFLIINFSYFKN